LVYKNLGESGVLNGALSPYKDETQNSHSKEYTKIYRHKEEVDI